MKSRGSGSRSSSAWIIAIAVVAAGAVFGLLYDVFDRAVRRWADHDLERRAALVARSLGDLTRPSLERIASGDDLVGLVACSPAGVVTAGATGDLGCDSQLALAAVNADAAPVRATLGTRSVGITAHALAGGRLFLIQNRAFLDRRRELVLGALFLGAEATLVALLLLARAGVRIGRRRAEEAARQVVRQMRSRDVSAAPIAPELRLLVRDVSETVAYLRTERSSGAARLRDFAAAAVPPGGLVVVANREPYAHERQADGGVSVARPASGLVTGIEPVLRACGGTWVAYGGGSADRDVTDTRGRIAVPPEKPEYTLRRLWIGDDEYEPYYSGFANEGLWPLCHIAHTQPSFRSVDWIAYQAVNESFARAAVDEASADGVVLIQDYHLALVPRLVRELAPHLVTSIFWHIPWPNSEVVGICPWKEALLEGMIGADVVGFHTRQYCLNFLETAQRYLECRVDFDEMAVTYGGHRTAVRPYPMSVEWPYPAEPRSVGAALREELGIGAGVHVSLGVDRADYTKGLLERFAAVERLLEANPSLAGKYVLVQLASPTRTRIRKYQQLADDVTEAAARINARFGRDGWEPILLRMRTFPPDEVRRHYAMADSALVTPLHDGMNLVAKEYAAACNDGDGVLVLSVFAGAAKELEGALIVNPYDTEAVAQAILRAVTMPAAERRARMKAMRQQIAASSIYDWSERLLRDMCDAREQRARFWPAHRAAARLPLREVAG